VAAQAAVNPQTLRDYERRGMLAAPARTDSGYRAYPSRPCVVATCDPPRGERDCPILHDLDAAGQARPPIDHTGPDGGRR
jgi:MerR family regulatory protein